MPSDAQPRRPATLAEVKAGDEVVIDTSRHNNMDGIVAIVTKLTPHSIVIRDLRFRRSNGSQIGGDKWFPPRLAFGPAADAILKAPRRRKLATALKRGCDFTQAAITDFRRACDEAEAMLRDAGEWRGEP